MIFKGFPQSPYSGLLPEMMRQQAYYRPIRDTVAMKKGGLVPKGKHMMPDGTMMLDSAHKSKSKKHSAKPHGNKGSAEMKAHMAKLRAMKK